MPSSRKSPPSHRVSVASTSQTPGKRLRGEGQGAYRKPSSPPSARRSPKGDNIQDREKNSSYSKDRGRAATRKRSEENRPQRKLSSLKSSERRTIKSSEGRGTGPKIVRLQRYLAECGVASRRGAEEVIFSGKVRVNERVVTEPSYKIEVGRDRVRVGKRSVIPPPKGILLFHKPRGVVSTLEDPESRPCVGDYITKHFRSYFPVGRLDYDSSGLMVLTNDGELAERLMHPRFGLERVYEARVEGYVQPVTLAKAARGVTLDDGRASATITIDEPGAKSTWIRVRVAEGRNRLVRRLMQRLGHPVEKLRRLSHGPFVLGKLQPGDMRRLSEKEYESARNRVMNFSKSSSTGVGGRGEIQGRSRSTKDGSRRDSEDLGIGRSSSSRVRSPGVQFREREQEGKNTGGRDRPTNRRQGTRGGHAVKSEGARRGPRSPKSKRWRGA